MPLELKQAEKLIIGEDSLRAALRQELDNSTGAERQVIQGNSSPQQTDEAQEHTEQAREVLVADDSVQQPAQAEKVEDAKDEKLSSEDVALLGKKLKKVVRLMKEIEDVEGAEGRESKKYLQFMKKRSQYELELKLSHDIDHEVVPQSGTKYASRTQDVRVFDQVTNIRESTEDVKLLEKKIRKVDKLLSEIIDKEGVAGKRSKKYNQFLKKRAKYEKAVKDNERLRLKH